MFSQVNIQMQDSMQLYYYIILKVTMQWNQNIKNICAIAIQNTFDNLKLG